MAEVSPGDDLYLSAAPEGFPPVSARRRTVALPARLPTLENLERHFEAELRRMSPNWTFNVNGAANAPVDVADAVGVPPMVLGVILAGKCRDQLIPVTAERQKRFAEWIHAHCASLWLNFQEVGVGPECVKGVVLALTSNDRFTSLNLACNALGDSGGALVGKMLPENNTLVQLDLSGNGLGCIGATALFEGLRRNRSVTSVDLSARCGSLRNQLTRQCGDSLEKLVATNPVLAKLSLPGTRLGAEGTVCIARGLSGNSSLLSLDLANNELGLKGVVALADALGSCILEELNLSENRLGDEGLVALAARLGALPRSAEAASSTGWGQSEAVKASYQESCASLQQAVADVDLVAAHSEDTRSHDVDRIAGAAAQLTKAVAAVSVPVPRLRVLLLANNGATMTGASRVQDCLQVNSVLERLSLDQAEHKEQAQCALSLMASLPLNSTLRSLSLEKCGLGSVGVKGLAKALAFNTGLEVLSLRGNRFDEEAAAALAAALGTAGTPGARSLRQLNLSSCHLDDSCGVLLAKGLAANVALEGLQLRDNLLREGAGRALLEALNRHTGLLVLSLELNSIDLRCQAQISRLLARNARLREKQRPQRYTKRIGELLVCQREVGVLTSTLNRNLALKRKMRLKQAVALQMLRDAEEEERAKQQWLEEELVKVEADRREMETQAAEAQDRLRTVVSEGDYGAKQTRVRIESIEEQIRRHKKHIRHVERQLQQFEAEAGKELDVLQQELDRAENARSSASNYASVARRNLDSFAASLKSIEGEIAGGSDPRQRFEERVQPAEVSSGRRSHAPRNASRAIHQPAPQATRKSQAPRPRSGRASTMTRAKSR